MTYSADLLSNENNSSCTPHESIMNILETYDDNYHVPLLQGINKAYEQFTHAALFHVANLLESAMKVFSTYQKFIEQALIHNEKYMSVEEVWEVCMRVDELISSLNYILDEVEELQTNITAHTLEENKLK